MRRAYAPLPRGIMRLLGPLTAAALFLCVPAAARAHGVSQQIERRGDAFAVRVRYHHGRPLAGATYQVMRPGSAELARVGKTGADGWVEFVPDLPGTWHVKVVDRTGHGKTVAVEVPASANPSPSTPTPTPTSTSTPTSSSADADPGPGPLGVAAAAGGILAAFVLLAAVRRRGAGP